MLGLLERFRKRGREKAVIHTSRALIDLEQLCGDDKQTYEARHHTLFLDPRKIGASLKEVAENARKFTNERNLGGGRARIWYDIIGGLVICEGDVKRVIEFFSESQKISGLKYPILVDAEKAVAKAQE